MHFVNVSLHSLLCVCLYTRHFCYRAIVRSWTTPRACECAILRCVCVQSSIKLEKMQYVQGEVLFTALAHAHTQTHCTYSIDTTESMCRPTSFQWESLVEIICVCICVYMSILVCVYTFAHICGAWDFRIDFVTSPNDLCACHTNGSYKVMCDCCCCSIYIEMCS